MSFSDALVIGQVLYAIHDTALISVPKGERNARFDRIKFSGSEIPPSHPTTTHDSIELGPLDEIRSARAVTQWGGVQEVVLVTTAGLSTIAMNDRLELKRVPGSIAHPALVIAFDPTGSKTRSLALLETDASANRVAVVHVDLDSGVRGEPQTLPATVSGTPVAAELVRRGTALMLMIATIDSQGLLKVHAVAWSSLRAQTPAEQVLSLGLGRTLPGAQVSVTVTSMRKRSTDQQLAIAWPDNAGGGRVALVGWEDSGDQSKPATASGLQVLATALPDASFAAPELPIYRLAAADLLHTGAEQLVLGWPAVYGTVKGCVALMLFRLGEDARSLECTSRYAGANVDGQPWASIDLHLAAGVFGSCMGVQVIGGAASMKDLVHGNASVLGGFVSVDPNRMAFPEMVGGVPRQPSICVGPDGPGHGLATLGSNATRFLAFPSDLTGESVVLGPPTQTTVVQCSQLLGIIQAPPFDSRTREDGPSVSFVENEGQGSGGSLSTESSWALSNNVSANLGMGPVNLSVSTHNSYLNGTGKTTDSSTSSAVTFHESIMDQDMVIVLETEYTIWRYPVRRRSVGRGDASGQKNELLVVLPPKAHPRTLWAPASDFGYRPRSEVGMLLSYVDVEKDGYADENLLFKKLEGLSVGTKSNLSGVTFDKSDSGSIADSKHFNVMNSISVHAGLSQVFDWLTFGLNLEHSESFSGSTAETTHLQIHSSLSLSVASGSVTHPDYHYYIYPYFYVHKEFGCLMLAWEVRPKGGAWQPIGGESRLISPQICLIRPETNSKFAIKNRFSRAISFATDQDDRVTKVTVEIFNNGQTTAKNIECDFYDATEEFATTPLSSMDVAQLTVPERHIGKVQLDGTLNPIQRRTLVLEKTFTGTVLYIGVELHMDGIPSGAYWAVHPADTLKPTP